MLATRHSNRLQGLVATICRHYSAGADNVLGACSATNEPVLGYLKGSDERIALEKALEKYDNTVTDVPIVIGGKEYRTEEVHYQVNPYNHQKKLAKFYFADAKLMNMAIEASLKAKAAWAAEPFDRRAAVFLAAADMMAGEWRQEMNAATMLGQGKTIVQAEIDAACELVDFLRFNVAQAYELARYSPISDRRSRNTMRGRPLDGFVAAVTPFNFTAIGGNLASAPTIVGNTVVWKPSGTAILSNYKAFEIYREAGLPDGVINFCPSKGSVFGDSVTASPHLGAITFTGSVPTFRRLWRQVGENIDKYHCFPRLIGECGGKNYHLVHESADLDAVAAGTIRAAFEYSGQKCSACARLYVPESVWPALREKLLAIHARLKLGTPLEFDTFLTAVIDEKAFDRITAAIAAAHADPRMDVIAGGTYDKSRGFFIDPTIVEVKDAGADIVRDELFGPVLAVRTFPDARSYDDVFAEVRDATPFALTGAVFARDRAFLERARDALLPTAGNFYVNDKCTGSVVGQQPFGGAKLSGTNDKAGGPHYLLRYMSPQTTKETHAPLGGWSYPYMDEK